MARRPSPSVFLLDLAVLLLADDVLALVLRHGLGVFLGLGLGPEPLEGFLRTGLLDLPAPFGMRRNEVCVVSSGFSLAFGYLLVRLLDVHLHRLLCGLLRGLLDGRLLDRLLRGLLGLHPGRELLLSLFLPVLSPTE